MELPQLVEIQNLQLATVRQEENVRPIPDCNEARVLNTQPNKL